MKRKPPVDFARYGAVSLPIRYDPVTVLVQDPNAPRREGEPVPMIEKAYDSFVVDARCAGRGRLRAPSVTEAKKIGEPLAKELAKEGESAIKLTPEDKRIYVLARQTLAPLNLPVDGGARRLAGISGIRPPGPRALARSSAPAPLLCCHSPRMFHPLEHPPHSHFRDKLEPGVQSEPPGSRRPRCLDSAWVDCCVFLDRPRAFDPGTGKSAKVPFAL